MALRYGCGLFLTPGMGCLKLCSAFYGSLHQMIIEEASAAGARCGRMERLDQAGPGLAQCCSLAIVARFGAQRHGLAICPGTQPRVC